MTSQTQDSKYIIPARQAYTPQWNPASNANPGRTASAVPLQSSDTFEPRGRTGLVLVNGNISKSHVRKAEWIIRALPENLQEHFRKVGCQIKLGKTMDEIFPHLRDGDELVNNLAHTRSWREIRGHAFGKVVGIPEYIQERGKKELTRQTEPERGLDVQRHELGHVLHNTTGLLYDVENNEVNQEFLDAYTDDLNQMSYSQRKRFRYLIQTKDISNLSLEGIREAFAEVFAAAFGGGCRNDEAVMAAFPNTTRYIRNGVKNNMPKPEDYISGPIHKLLMKFAK